MNPFCDAECRIDDPRVSDKDCVLGAGHDGWHHDKLGTPFYGDRHFNAQLFAICPDHGVVPTWASIHQDGVFYCPVDGCSPRGGDSPGPWLFRHIPGGCWTVQEALNMGDPPPAIASWLEDYLNWCRDSDWGPQTLHGYERVEAVRYAFAACAFGKAKHVYVAQPNLGCKHPLKVTPHHEMKVVHHEAVEAGRAIGAMNSLTMKQVQEAMEAGLPLETKVPMKRRQLSYNGGPSVTLTPEELVLLDLGATPGQIESHREQLGEPPLVSVQDQPLSISLLGKQLDEGGIGIDDEALDVFEVGPEQREIVRLVHHDDNLKKMGKALRAAGYVKQHTKRGIDVANHLLSTMPRMRFLKTLESVGEGKENRLYRMAMAELGVNLKTVGEKAEGAMVDAIAATLKDIGEQDERSALWGDTMFRSLRVEPPETLEECFEGVESGIQIDAIAEMWLTQWRSPAEIAAIYGIGTWDHGRRMLPDGEIETEFGGIVLRTPNPAVVELDTKRRILARAAREQAEETLKDPTLANETLRAASDAGYLGAALMSTRLAVIRDEANRTLHGKPWTE